MIAYPASAVDSARPTPHEFMTDTQYSSRRARAPSRSSARQPLPWLLALLDAVGSGPAGKRVRQCPAHPDAHPSLSLGEDSDGNVLLFCHAGCDWSAILGALSLPAGYLYEPPPVRPADYAAAFCDVTFPPLSKRAGQSQQSRGYRLDKIHDYGPDHRVLRYRKGERKEMHWESLRDGVWVPGLFGTPTSKLPLYRESDVLKAIALDEPVILCESESSVDALNGAGLYATTWAGGANAVQVDRLADVLGDYPNLVVVPDNDAAGLACLEQLRTAQLTPHVLMPDAGQDARDLLENLGPDRLTEMLDKLLNT